MCLFQTGPDIRLEVCYVCILKNDNWYRVVYYKNGQYCYASDFNANRIRIFKSTFSFSVSGSNEPMLPCGIIVWRFL